MQMFQNSCGTRAAGRALGLVMAMALGALVFISSRAEAMKIQEVKSPGGITAWLVEEHGIPLIAMRFAFEGGNAQDPDAKEGVANFIASMMDEGGGEVTSKRLKGRLEEVAMRLSID